MKIFRNVPVRWPDLIMRRSTVIAKEIFDEEVQGELLQLGKASVVKDDHGNLPSESSLDMDEHIDNPNNVQLPQRRKTGPKIPTSQAKKAKNPDVNVEDVANGDELNFTALSTHYPSFLN